MSTASERRIKTMKRLYAVWGNTCILCGERFTVCNPATIEHIRPRSLGGTNDDLNLALAHALCNSIRGNASLVPCALAISTYKGTPSYRKRLSRILEPRKVEASILALKLRLSRLKVWEEEDA